MKLPTVVVREDVLHSWMHVEDCSKSQLADKLGVSKGRVSQLFKPQVEPSAHLMAKLLLLTQLPFDRLFIVLGSSVEGSAGRVVQPHGASRRRAANGHPKTPAPAATEGAAVRGSTTTI